TNRLVPKLTRIAIVGSTPIHFNIQNCTGTMTKAPPTPSRPDEKPVSRPAASSISIWNKLICVMKLPQTTRTEFDSLASGGASLCSCQPDGKLYFVPPAS